MESHLYATPEKDSDWDTKPLPKILKNNNYRHLGEKEKGEDLNMVNAELAGLKLLLHDAIKAQAHQENLRKKFEKKSKFLIFIILLLTNMLSIMSTGSITYYVTQDRDRQTVGLQSEQYGQSGHVQSGIGLIPTLHLGSEIVEKSEKKFEGKMTGDGELGATGITGITGITGRTGTSTNRERLTNISSQSSPLQLGSIWN